MVTAAARTSEMSPPWELHVLLSLSLSRQCTRNTPKTKVRWKDFVIRATKHQVLSRETTVFLKQLNIKCKIWYYKVYPDIHIEKSRKPHFRKEEKLFNRKIRQQRVRQGEYLFSNVPDVTDEILHRKQNFRTPSGSWEACSIQACIYLIEFIFCALFSAGQIRVVGWILLKGSINDYPSNSGRTEPPNIMQWRG